MQKKKPVKPKKEKRIQTEGAFAIYLFVFFKNRADHKTKKFKFTVNNEDEMRQLVDHQVDVLKKTYLWHQYEKIGVLKETSVRDLKQTYDYVVWNQEQPSEQTS